MTEREMVIQQARELSEALADRAWLLGMLAREWGISTEEAEARMTDDLIDRGFRWPPKHPMALCR